MALVGLQLGGLLSPPRIGEGGVVFWLAEQRGERGVTKQIINPGPKTSATVPRATPVIPDVATKVT